MTVDEGLYKIQDLILSIAKEDDLTSQILLEHLIDYSLEARDIRQTLIADEMINAPILVKTNSRKFIVH